MYRKLLEIAVNGNEEYLEALRMCHKYQTPDSDEARQSVLRCIRVRVVNEIEKHTDDYGEVEKHLKHLNLWKDNTQDLSSYIDYLKGEYHEGQQSEQQSKS